MTSLLLLLLACLATVSAQNNGVYVRVLNRLFTPPTAANLVQPATNPPSLFTASPVSVRMTLQPNGGANPLNPTVTTVNSVNTVSSNSLSDFELFDTKSRSATFSLQINGINGLNPAGQLCILSLSAGYNTVIVTQTFQAIPDPAPTCGVAGGTCSAGAATVDSVSVSCNVLPHNFGQRACATTETLFTRFDTEVCTLQLRDNTAHTTLNVPANLELFRTDVVLPGTQAPGAGSLSTAAVSLADASDFDLKTCAGTSLASLVAGRNGRLFEVMTGLTGSGLTNNVKAHVTGFVNIVNGAYRTSQLVAPATTVVTDNSFKFAIFAGSGTTGALLREGIVQAAAALQAWIELRQGTYTVAIYDNDVTTIVQTDTTVPAATPLVTAPLTIAATSRNTYQVVVLSSVAGGNHNVPQPTAPTASVVTVSNNDVVNTGETQYTVFNYLINGPSLSLFDSDGNICADLVNTLAQPIAISGGSAKFVSTVNTLSSTVLAQRDATSRRSIGTTVTTLASNKASSSGAGRVDAGCQKKVHFVLGRQITYTQPVLTPSNGCSVVGGGTFQCPDATVSVLTSVAATGGAAPQAGVTVVTLDIDSCNCATPTPCTPNLTCEQQFLLGEINSSLAASQSAIAGSVAALGAAASGITTATVNGIRPSINALSATVVNNVNKISADLEDQLDDALDDIEEIVEDGVDDNEDAIDDLADDVKDSLSVSEKNQKLIKQVRGQNAEVLAALALQP